MSWVFVIGLAIIAFAVIAAGFKAPRTSWEAAGAALLIGVAGYGLQGSPWLRGAPKPAPETIEGGEAAAEVSERQKLSGENTATDQYVVTADALARHGQYADAAEYLRGAVERDPNNAEAWLAMANALVGHAEGTISPAAIYAYGRSARASPDSPGPPFFLGLALIRSGRLGEGRALWGELLARTPKDAPWRADLESRLAELDAAIAREQSSR